MIDCSLFNHLVLYNGDGRNGERVVTKRIFPKKPPRPHTEGVKLQHGRCLLTERARHGMESLMLTTFLVNEKRISFVRFAHHLKFVGSSPTGPKDMSLQRARTNAFAISTPFVVLGAVGVVNCLQLFRPLFL